MLNLPRLPVIPDSTYRMFRQIAEQATPNPAQDYAVATERTQELLALDGTELDSDPRPGCVLGTLGQGSTQISGRVETQDGRLQRSQFQVGEGGDHYLIDSDGDGTFRFSQHVAADLPGQGKFDGYTVYRMGPAEPEFHNVAGELTDSKGSIQFSVSPDYMRVFRPAPVEPRLGFKTEATIGLGRTFLAQAHAFEEQLQAFDQDPQDVLPAPGQVGLMTRTYINDASGTLLTGPDLTHCDAREGALSMVHNRKPDSERIFLVESQGEREKFLAFERSAMGENFNYGYRLTNQHV